MFDYLETTETSQAELEMLYSKYQMIPALKQEFREAGFEAKCLKHNIPVAFGLDFLVQIALHKRAKLPVMIGLLRKHFKDKLKPAQACADAILKAVEADFCDWHPMSKELIVRYLPDDETQALLDKFQFPLPMIVEPDPVRKNTDTGYQTVRGSIILKDNHHSNDVCLDHINRVNNVPLTVNEGVLTFIQNQWKNCDKKKESEDWKEFEQRKKNFDTYQERAENVLSFLARDQFWLTHRYDKRGRTYVVGYYANYQSNDWCKSMIQFAEKETLK